MQFNKINSEFTARLQSNINESWLTRIPEHVDFDCLLFQGAPDLIINTTKGEGIITAFSPNDEDEEMDQDTEEEDLPSSQWKARIQIAHQMYNVKPY